ncbi:hypothetical protein C8R45DRAFT_1068111 [Mycena sanguinolenta]|nr:hypothetical protein C8R45DRAFT_1068111 [Mycena sanguinolenta]
MPVSANRQRWSLIVSNSSDHPEKGTGFRNLDDFECAQFFGAHIEEVDQETLVRGMSNSRRLCLRRTLLYLLEVEVFRRTDRETKRGDQRARTDPMGLVAAVKISKSSATPASEGIPPIKNSNEIAKLDHNVGMAKAMFRASGSCFWQIRPTLDIEPTGGRDAPHPKNQGTVSGDSSNRARPSPSKVDGWTFYRMNLYIYVVP